VQSNSSIFRKAHIGAFSHHEENNVWGSALSDVHTPIDGFNELAEATDHNFDRQDLFSNSMLDEDDSEDEFEVKQSILHAGKSIPKN
jgi:hypothetical protein